MGRRFDMIARTKNKQNQDKTSLTIVRLLANCYTLLGHSPSTLDFRHGDCPTIIGKKLR